MRERAILAGGELTIDANPGHGTAIFVRLPTMAVEGRDPSSSVG